MRKPIATTLLLMLLGATAACAVHEPRPAFRARVFIGDRGISVPLPPPSLTDAPQQDVEVDGQLMGEAEIVEGTTVHVVDNVEGGRASVVVEANATGFTAELFVDLQDNCLELWVEAPDGRESDRALFHTEVTPDDDIVVFEGC